MNKKILGVFMALMVLFPAGVAMTGSVMASETVATDGTAVDSDDRTNTTKIATNSDLDNVTIQMTENQQVSASGSTFYESNVTPASASVDSSSGSGTAEVSVVDDGVYVNETGGASSVTVESLNVTYNVSGDVNSSDAINVSYDNWMENSTQLIADDDGSEVQNYIVYATDKVVDVDYEFKNADLEINESENEIRSTGGDNTGQLVMEVTRNNTTYEGWNLSNLDFEVAFNTTYFSGIEETTDENTDRIVLKNVTSEDGEKAYAWSVVNPNNDTNTYDVTVNVTAESGEANETFSHTSVQDPDGGVQSEGTTTYATAMSGGIVGPDFTNILDQIGLVGAAVGVVVILGLAYFLRRDKGDGAMRGYAAYGGAMGYVWFIPVILGVSMIADFILGSGFTFWTDLITAQTPFGDMATAVGGLVMLGIALGLNASSEV